MAIQILYENADDGYFTDGYGEPYFFYPGLEGHPEYPALINKFKLWQENQRNIYSIDQKPVTAKLYGETAYIYKI